LGPASSVTNLHVSTGAPAVLDILSLSDPGNLEFIDRPARFIQMPSAYVGKEMIRLARNDGANSDSNNVSFNTNVTQSVCVGWDSTMA
jgi:hypothetical protein